MKGAFGPRNEEERLVFAIEELRADVQLTIQEVMFAKGISRSDLAKSLGCSPANVTQLLAEDGNPTIETIARVLYALGDVGKFQSSFLEEQAVHAGQVRQRGTGPTAGWRMKVRDDTDIRGKRHQPQATSEMVIMVARDAARSQTARAHNQNVIPPDMQRQAA